MLHIDPIPHEVRKVAPLLGVHHHIATAMRIILFDRNLLANIFFSDTQFFFNPQFYGQSMGVPTCFTIHLESLHGLVSAKNVLNGTRHHVVTARVSIGRGRTFKENIGWATFALADAAMEEISLIPFFQHFFINGV